MSRISNVSRNSDHLSMSRKFSTSRFKCLSSTSVYNQIPALLRQLASKSKPKPTRGTCNEGYSRGRCRHDILFPFYKEIGECVSLFAPSPRYMSLQTHLYKTMKRTRDRLSCCSM